MKQLVIKHSLFGGYTRPLLCSSLGSVLTCSSSIIFEVSFHCSSEDQCGEQFQGAAAAGTTLWASCQLPLHQSECSWTAAAGQQL